LLYKDEINQAASESTSTSSTIAPAKRDAEHNRGMPNATLFQLWVTDQHTGCRSLSLQLPNQLRVSL